MLVRLKQRKCDQELAAHTELAAAWATPLGVPQFPGRFA